MNRINPDVDVIKDVLKTTLAVQPMSSFIQSLLRQYEERGSLSKKQLQGLYNKAQKIKTIPEICPTVMRSPVDVPSGAG